MNKSDQLYGLIKESRAAEIDAVKEHNAALYMARSRETDSLISDLYEQIAALELASDLGLLKTVGC